MKIRITGFNPTKGKLCAAHQLHLLTGINKDDAISIVVGASKHQISVLDVTPTQTEAYVRETLLLYGILLS